MRRQHLTAAIAASILFSLSACEVPDEEPVLPEDDGGAMIDDTEVVEDMPPPVDVDEAPEELSAPMGEPVDESADPMVEEAPVEEEADIDPAADPEAMEPAEPEM